VWSTQSLWSFSVTAVLCIGAACDLYMSGHTLISKASAQGGIRFPSPRIQPGHLPDCEPCFLCRQLVMMTQRCQ
jgi:hypothetical protein